MDITEKDLEDVLTSLVANTQRELYETPQENLDNYYFFRYDKSKSREWNLYKFVDLLDLYRSSCRKWEEHHNGSGCVVERVRDKYLMPKIKEFLIELEK